MSPSRLHEVLVLSLAGAIFLVGCSSSGQEASGREAAAPAEAASAMVTQSSASPSSLESGPSEMASADVAEQSAAPSGQPSETASSDGAGASAESEPGPVTALGGRRAPDCYLATTTYRCVRFTFKNPLNRRIFIPVNGKELGSQTLNLAPGESGEVTGYTGTWKDTDISGDIEICNWPDGFNGGGWCPSRDNKKWKLGSFSARNPQIGKPCVQWRYEDCVDMREGDVYRTKDGNLEFTRLPDDGDYINFSVNLRYR